MQRRLPASRHRVGADARVLGRRPRAASSRSRAATRCARFVWYPRAALPRAAAASAHVDAVSGRGTLFSWSVVQRACSRSSPDACRSSPALVALEEDPAVRWSRDRRLRRRSALRVDMPVRVVFRPLRFAGIDAGGDRRRSSRPRHRADPSAQRESRMSELFHDVASIDYPIIDADAHVNEPPDLWQERVPARLRAARAQGRCTPSDGDVWIFDDGKKLRPLGLTATAGLTYLRVPALRPPLRRRSAPAASTPPRGSRTSTPTASTRRSSIRA